MLVESNHDILLAELVQRVADALQNAPATLSTPCKEPDIVRAKAMISHLTVRKLGIKGVEVATTLG